jgi:chemotaxis protein CheX
MRVEIVGPFIDAAREVLESELSSKVERGKLALCKTSSTTQDVTTLIGVTGNVQGMVLYGMSAATAKEIVGRMMDQPFTEFDDLAQSGIAELGNVITGRASMKLSDAGFTCNIAPPVLITGFGTVISTLDIQRLVVEMNTDCGPMEIQVALKESL